MNEIQSRDLMVELAASLFARGFSVGSAGNISMRVDDGFLITPTNSSLGRLDPGRIAKSITCQRQAFCADCSCQRRGQKVGQMTDLRHQLIML